MSCLDSLNSCISLNLQLTASYHFVNHDEVWSKSVEHPIKLSEFDDPKNKINCHYGHFGSFEIIKAKRKSHVEQCYCQSVKFIPNAFKPIS